MSDYVLLHSSSQNAVCICMCRVNWLWRLFMLRFWSFQPRLGVVQVQYAVRHLNWVCEGQIGATLNRNRHMNAESVGKGRDFGIVSILVPICSQRCINNHIWESHGWLHAGSLSLWTTKEVEWIGQKVIPEHTGYHLPLFSCFFPSLYAFISRLNYILKKTNRTEQSHIKNVSSLNRFKVHAL